MTPFARGAKVVVDGDLRGTVIRYNATLGEYVVDVGHGTIVAKWDMVVELA